MNSLPRYETSRTYDWNFQHAPAPVELDVPPVPGPWQFCGLPVASPLGIPAGPLLNGRWCLYYASLGFDVLTYKTVRSSVRSCYPVPNLQPVTCGSLKGSEDCLTVAPAMQGSWAVSFGMPSQSPEYWRSDVERTRKQLLPGKLLVVSVVGTVQKGWTIDDLAADYALCARWAVDSGADVVEVNFSCPNVATCDGQLYQHARHAEQVAKHVRDTIGNVPLVIKIGHLPSRDAAALLIRAVGEAANALSMVNCIATKLVDESQQMLFDGRPRGIGGEAIRDASLAQIAMFHELMREAEKPAMLVGVGGVFTTQHVVDYLARGASAVQLATAVMLNPGIGLQIKQELAARPSACPSR